MSAKASIALMLVFGTGTVVTQKVLFSLDFKKPWFQTEAMFLGMFLCLIVYEINRCVTASKKRAADPLIEKPADQSMQHISHYFVVAVPSIFDLVATCLGNISLLNLDASVWQMLRGSMVVFSALISMCFLKRKYVGYHWTGIGLVTLGLLIVSLGTILLKEKEPAPTEGMVGANGGLVLVSILLVLLAQVIQASQIVVEEYLLKNVKAAASLIVGLEGMWGFLLGLLCLYAVQHSNFPNPALMELFHEDTIETFRTLKVNHALQAFSLVYVCCILFYNLFAMMVTQHFSAVYRTILEALRTACIWVVMMIIYYVYGKNLDEPMGEPFTVKSVVQLIGFGTLLCGNFIYNKVIRFKFFHYEDQPAAPVEEKKELKEV